jgi:hypothetical protein
MKTSRDRFSCTTGCISSPKLDRTVNFIYHRQNKSGKMKFKKSPAKGELFMHLGKVEK